MTRDDDFIGQLEGYLDEHQGLTPLPDAVRLAVRAELPTTRQIGPVSGPMRYLNMKRAVQAAIAAAAVLLVAFLGIQAFGGPSHGGPDASPSATSEPSTAVSSPVEGTSLEDVVRGDGMLVTGTTYTSTLFEPRVTFLLASRDDARGTSGKDTDSCSPANGGPYLQTSARTIVLMHPKGCLADVRMIRPFEVHCGSADQHPDSANLATAILATLGTAAHDHGTLQDSEVVPSDLFVGTYQGRVIKIGGDSVPLRPFDVTADDPDHCRFQADPASGDPTIEIRGDSGALLLLIDVDGELVVLRTSGGGYDGATIGDARGRGYLDGGGIEEHMLKTIYDIAFGG